MTTFTADSLPQTSLLIGDDDNSTLRSQEELDEMWNKSFRRELPVPSKYGEDLTGLVIVMIVIKIIFFTKVNLPQEFVNNTDSFCCH